MTENIYFKVEGEWLTQFFRNYYWNGEHTYEEAVEYIIKFFVLPDEQSKKYIRTEIAPYILNGTKKLVGDENYTLEEDDAEKEYHSSIAYRKEMKQKAQEIKKQAELSKIEEYKVQHKGRPLKRIKYWDYNGTSDWDFEYWAVPDEDMESEYGLIAPNGDYYSCDFAMHEGLAAHLIERDSNMRLGCMQKYESKYSSVRDHALEYLYSLGWLSLRNPFPGGAVYPNFAESKYQNEEDLPQAMLDTLYDWRMKHRV